MRVSQPTCSQRRAAIPKHTHQLGSGAKHSGLLIGFISQSTKLIPTSSWTRKSSTQMLCYHPSKSIMALAFNQPGRLVRAYRKHLGISSAEWLVAYYVALHCRRRESSTQPSNQTRSVQLRRPWYVPQPHPNTAHKTLFRHHLPCADENYV